MEPRTSMEGNALKCTCAVEHTGDTGQVSRRQLLRSAWLDLGRNEVDDVVLKLSHPEGKLGPFTIREHVVHKRFLKDGKATIRLLTQRVQFLVSNCPRSSWACSSAAWPSRWQPGGNSRGLSGE